MLTDLNISIETAVLIAIGSIALVIFSMVALQIIFSKFYEDAWRAWVPFLNIWTLFEISGMSGAWIFSLFFPPLGAIALLMAVYKISKSLGYDGTGMVLLSVLSPTLWLLVIALLRNKSDEELRYIENKNLKIKPVVTIVNQSEGIGRSWTLDGMPNSIQQPPPPPAPAPELQRTNQSQGYKSEDINFGYGRNHNSESY